MSGDGKPIGGGGAGTERSLANLTPKPENLVPGAGAWKKGDAPARKHGATPYLRNSKLALDNPLVQDVESAILDALPWRDRDGGAPEADRLMANAAAQQYALAVEVRVWRLKDRPESESPLPSIGLESVILGRFGRALGDLGLTPAGRARVMADLASAERDHEDIALRWARQAQTEQEASDG